MWLPVCVSPCCQVKGRGWIHSSIDTKHCVYWSGEKLSPQTDALLEILVCGDGGRGFNFLHVNYVGSLFVCLSCAVNHHCMFCQDLHLLVSAAAQSTPVCRGASSQLPQIRWLQCILNGWNTLGVQSMFPADYLQYYSTLRFELWNASTSLYMQQASFLGCFIGG